MKRLLGAALLVACACEPSGDGRVRVAIDELRAAPPKDTAARRRLLDALKGVPGASAVGKQAQDACVKAYTAHIEAFELLAKAKASDTNEDMASAAQRTLDATDLMPACDAASVALTRRLR